LVQRYILASYRVFFKQIAIALIRLFHFVPK
jgi:hypothetical protein